MTSTGDATHLCGTTRPIKLIGPQAATPVDSWRQLVTKPRIGYGAPTHRAGGARIAECKEVEIAAKTQARGRNKIISGMAIFTKLQSRPISCRSATAGRCSHPAGARASIIRQAGPACRKRHAGERQLLGWWVFASIFSNINPAMPPARPAAAAPSRAVTA